VEDAAIALVATVSLSHTHKLLVFCG
jgi:hypothetical protein